MKRTEKIKQNISESIMKKVNWSDVFDIETDEPMTKEDYKKGIEWAESEIKEWKDFIKTCKERLDEKIS